MPEEWPSVSNPFGQGRPLSMCLFTELDPQRSLGSPSGVQQGFPRSAASCRGSGLALGRKEGVLRPSGVLPSGQPGGAMEPRACPGLTELIQLM